jgi:hypothetical protein
MGKEDWFFPQLLLTNQVRKPGKRSIAIPSKGIKKEIAIVLLVWQMSLSECFFARPFYRIFCK